MATGANRDYRSLNPSPLGKIKDNNCGSLLQYFPYILILSNEFSIILNKTRNLNRFYQLLIVVDFELE